MPAQIPYPNNELGPPIPPPTGSYRTEVDYATSSSYADTASFTLGFILSSSYSNFAETASFLLGSIANAVSASWANYSGHALTADSASYALSSSYAKTASYAKSVDTASYSLQSSSSIASSYSVSSSYLSATASNAYNSVSSSWSATASYALNVIPSESSSYVSGSSAVVGRLTLANTGINAYMVSRIVTGVTFSQPVDSFPDVEGNSAKWLVSLNDGIGFKTSELIAIWEPTTNVTNFSEVTTNVIGSVPVAMSVNISGDQVRLIANPASGSWTIKSIRFVL